MNLLTKNKLEKVKQLIDEGVKSNDALKQVKLSWGSWGKYRHLVNAAGKSVKIHRVTSAVPQRTQKMIKGAKQFFVIITDDLRSVLEALE